jgi:hypothetical protein
MDLLVLHVDANGKTGQVAGNIVSAWPAAFAGWFTKYLTSADRRKATDGL